MKNLVNTIFKAVALAMSVAVIVLSVLSQSEVKDTIIMLGIGLACLAISQLQVKKEEKEQEGIDVKWFMMVILGISLICMLVTFIMTAKPANESSSAVPKKSQVEQAATEDMLPEEETSSSSVEKTIVSADFATDNLNVEYTDGNTDHQVTVVFSANTDISKFRYLEIGFVDPERSDAVRIRIEKVLYLSKVLSQNDPIALSMHFDGDLPSRGISYFDEKGIERFFTVSISGEDGSLQLTEFDPMNPT